MVAIYCYMEKGKALKMPGGANENKYGIDENMSCSSIIKNHRRIIQVCFSRRGKIPGSRMDIVIIFLFFAFVVHIF